MMKVRPFQLYQQKFLEDESLQNVYKKIPIIKM